MGIGVVDDHDVEGLVAREVEDVATLEAQTPRIDIRETGACAGKHLLREVEGDDRLRLANLAAERFGDVPIGRLLQLASEVIYRSRLAKGGIYAR